MSHAIGVFRGGQLEGDFKDEDINLKVISQGSSGIEVSMNACHDTKSRDFGLEPPTYRSQVHLYLIYCDINVMFA